MTNTFLIADSGSTKTAWRLVAPGGGTLAAFHSQGINPFHQTEDEIRGILAGEAAPRLDGLAVGRLCFYGSGIRPEMEPAVRALLGAAFPSAGHIEVASDLLGAARALCGRRAGVACILGTGSNSCLYDGRQIVLNTPPLGYILGDEGSGAVLGAHLLNGLYKGWLPGELRRAFEETCGTDLPGVVRRVYREPLANRFLASLSPFVRRHIACAELERMVVGCFRQFLDHNVRPYLSAQDSPVSALGSVAFHYSRQLEKALEAEGMRKGTIVQGPMDGLVRYHLDLPE